MLKHDKEIAQPSRPQHRATPILKQQLAMGVGMGRSSALVYNESCKIPTLNTRAAKYCIRAENE